jgi:hypothetical protein
VEIKLRTVKQTLVGDFCLRNYTGLLQEAGQTTQRRVMPPTATQLL